MNEADLAFFLDSFERCLQNDRFIKVFYEIFNGSSEEIPVFFVETDFAKQRLKNQTEMIFWQEKKKFVLLESSLIKTSEVPDFRLNSWLANPVF